MKKKLTLSILALLAVTLTGCEDSTHFGMGFDDRIITMEYNGHSYIVYKGASKGGITHDPDCPCREKGGEE